MGVASGDGPRMCGIGGAGGSAMSSGRSMYASMMLVPRRCGSVVLRASVAVKKLELNAGTDLVERDSDAEPCHKDLKIGLLRMLSRRNRSFTPLLILP